VFAIAPSSSRLSKNNKAIIAERKLIMTTAPDTKIEIKKQYLGVLNSDLPLENAFASVIIVSMFHFATGTPDTYTSALTMALALFLSMTAIDALAPSMSTSFRLTIPVFFSLQKK
jgi:hypothetical protein